MTWNELKAKLHSIKGELSWNEFEQKMGPVRGFMQGAKEYLSSAILETLVEQSILTQEDAAGLKEPPKIEYVPIESIKPHPLNAEIYSDGADTELLESIKEKGIVTPIIITEDGTIISGHRRHNAAMMLCLKEVPVIRIKPIDALEAEELLILTNKQRNKTIEQIAREYDKLKAIEAEKARRRMLSGKSDPTVNSPEGTGEAREKAAEALGMGYQKAERASKVVQHIENLKKQGKIEEAEEIRATLNNKSVNAAYKSVVEKKSAEPICTEQESNAQQEPEPLEEKLARLEKKLEHEMQDNARLYAENQNLRSENRRLKLENQELCADKISLTNLLTKKKNAEEKENEGTIFGMLYSVTCNGLPISEWFVNPNQKGNQYEFTHKPTNKKFLFVCTPVAIIHLSRLFQVDDEIGLLLIQKEQEMDDARPNSPMDIGYGS